MAAKQRDISVSEFFAKNRHLLGFDNPRKALLTTVKEAVDNSLDACEEAGILPEIWVHIEATGPDRFKVGIQDNGPGIVKKQIPLIFGKLLGPAGLLVAVPSLAVLMVVVRRILIHRIYEGHGFHRAARDRVLVLRVRAARGGVFVPAGPPPDVIALADSALLRSA